MVRLLDEQLALWENDDAIQAVIVRGAGERAFCAGGDVQQLYEDKSEKRVREKFFREEYCLNRRIHNYKKPYIALMNGITMGGGVGLSVHAGMRIASENTLFAMPETGIGFFPDVGASWFLPRLPGEIGMFIAITGARLNGADCIYAGLCDAFVPNARHDSMIAAIREGQFLDSVIREYSVRPEEAELKINREVIDRCFAAETVESILSALEFESGEWAERQLAIISGKSPTSLKIAFRQLRKGKALNFDDCMIMEYRMSQHVMAGHDFFEGVRAVVIEKDMSPKWLPSSLADLTDGDIESYFMPLGKPELKFASQGRK